MGVKPTLKEMAERLQLKLIDRRRIYGKSPEMRKAVFKVKSK